LDVTTVGRTQGRFDRARSAACCAGCKLPKVAVIVDEIPRNPSGKILERVLREQLPDKVRAPE
jgi:acyl-CoA synthetase (AMP-forming)/AMP-acid ligase II